MEHVVALMDIAELGAFEAEGLSISLTRLTPHPHFSGPNNMMPKRVHKFHKQISYLATLCVPLSTPVPRSYHTRGLMLRVTIIHLNHKLALVQCVCVCVCVCARL